MEKEATDISSAESVSAEEREPAEIVNAPARTRPSISARRRPNARGAASSSDLSPHQTTLLAAASQLNRSDPDEDATESEADFDDLLDEPLVKPKRKRTT